MSIGRIDIHKNKKEKDEEFRRNQKKPPKGVISLIGLIAVLLVVIGYIYIRTITQGAEAAKKAYEVAYEESKEAARQEAYNDSYDISFKLAEMNNHVSNVLVLELGDIQEISTLEVLEVSGADFNIEKAEDNDEKNESWLEVKASGVYVIDMTNSEFIFDSQRKVVFARVAKPVMDKKHFSISDNQQILFVNDKVLSNGSNKGGQALINQQLKDSYDKIYEELTTNQEYYENAEKSATLIIENLVKNLNPSISDLIVEVEFVE